MSIRFTKVYANPLTRLDVFSVVRNKFPYIPCDILELLVNFNWRLHDDIVVKRMYGQVGSLWGFNLRDVFRICQLMLSMNQAVNKKNEGDSIVYNPQLIGELMQTICLQRFRKDDDRRNIALTFEEIFGYQVDALVDPLFRITEKIASFGNVILARRQEGDVLTTPFTFSSSGGLVEPTLFRSQLRPLQSIALCIRMNWPILLVGTHSSGKSTLLQIISQCCGRFLDEISLSSSSDVSDLIGCFEQKEDKTSWFKDSMIHKLINAFELIFNSVCLDLHLEDKILDEMCDSYWVSIQGLKRLLGIHMKQRSSLNPQHLVNQIKEFLSNIEAVTKRYPHATEILNARIVEANHLLSFVKVFRSSASRDKSKSINFHWVDGPLIRAMLEGCWFHLENVRFLLRFLVLL